MKGDLILNPQHIHMTTVMNCLSLGSHFLLKIKVTKVWKFFLQFYFEFFFCEFNVNTKSARSILFIIEVAGILPIHIHCSLNGYFSSPAKKM